MLNARLIAMRSLIMICGGRRARMVVFLSEDFYGTEATYDERL